ncbi:MAG: hypothetical protein AB7T06_10730 [Kofleriaceae bacterium]
MEKQATKLVTFAIAIVTSACGSSGRTPGYIGTTTITQKDEVTTMMFGFDANRRGTLVRIDNDGRLIDSCAEPPPDSTAALALKASIAGTGESALKRGSIDAEARGGASGSYESTQSIVQLGERTAETLFLREVLFRRCEASMNSRAVTKSSNGAVSVAAVELDATDKFLNDAMGAYTRLAETRERSQRQLLIREFQARLPEDALKDPKLLELLGQALTDPAKVADVYKRAAELLKAAEEKKAKAAADKAACETKASEERSSLFFCVNA